MLEIVEIQGSIITELDKYKQQFAESKPFKYVVMDNFLEESFADSLLNDFPSIEKMSKAYYALNENKSEETEISKISPNFSRLNDLLLSDKFTSFLGNLTDIENLLSDNSQFGGGIHQGANGSYLDVHADFNIHPIRNIHRRLNVLIYLNKNWKNSMGGLLELWTHDMKTCFAEIVPIFNRCVIFETNEISFHGYDLVKCESSETRKSIASYYYTVNRSENEITNKHTTVFKARPKDKVKKKLLTGVRNKLANIYNKIAYKGDKV